MPLPVEEIMLVLKTHFAGLEPAALTVHRVQKMEAGRDYYLVAFQDAHTKKYMAVTLDAQSLKVGQSAETKHPLTVIEPMAVRELQQAENVEVALVWGPSKLSFSPFYPFWKVKKEGKTFFIDKNGNEVADLTQNRG
jgi:hypothetical protein